MWPWFSVLTVYLRAIFVFLGVFFVAFIFFDFLLLLSKLSGIVGPPLEVASTLQDHCLPQTTVTEPNFIGGPINYYIIGCRKFLQTSLEKKIFLLIIILKNIIFKYYLFINYYYKLVKECKLELVQQENKLTLKMYPIF